MLALGNDVVMLNDHARNALSPVDQAALITQATEALGGASRAPSRWTCRAGRWRGCSADRVAQPGDGLPDGVVHVKLVSGARVRADDGRDAVPRRGPAECPAAAPMSLPGLVGHGAAWRRACRAAEARYDAGSG